MRIQNINNVKVDHPEEELLGRIAGIDIPKDKRAVVALTYIFGVGRASSIKILESAG